MHWVACGSFSHIMEDEEFAKCYDEQWMEEDSGLVIHILMVRLKVLYMNLF
jgi:hypothetical protein